MDFRPSLCNRHSQRRRKSFNSGEFAACAVVLSSGHAEVKHQAAFTFLSGVTTGAMCVPCRIWRCFPLAVTLHDFFERLTSFDCFTSFVQTSFGILFRYCSSVRTLGAIFLTGQKLYAKFSVGEKACLKLSVQSALATSSICHSSMPSVGVSDESSHFTRFLACVPFPFGGRVLFRNPRLNLISFETQDAMIESTVVEKQLSFLRLVLHLPVLFR